MHCPECQSTHNRKNGKKVNRITSVSVVGDSLLLTTTQPKATPGYWATTVRQPLPPCGRWLPNGKCSFYVTDGWSVYPGLIADGDQIVSKTDMTRVEAEHTRLRHYLARLHRKTLCYSKAEEMLRHSIRLLLHYLKFWDVPVPS